MKSSTGNRKRCGDIRGEQGVQRNYWSIHKTRRSEKSKKSEKVQLCFLRIQLSIVSSIPFTTPHVVSPASADAGVPLFGPRGDFCPRGGPTGPRKRKHQSPFEKYGGGPAEESNRGCVHRHTSRTAHTMEKWLKKHKIVDDSQLDTSLIFRRIQRILSPAVFCDVS